MSKINTLAFIGRLSPMTLAHEFVIREGLKKAENVVVVLGSSYRSRTIRNPFTFEERATMVKTVFPEENVKVVPVRDYTYNNVKWVSAVQSAVYSAMPFSAGPAEVGLIGHSKDASSFYLDMFPGWSDNRINVPNYKNINATDVREKFFSSLYEAPEFPELNPKVAELLVEFSRKDDVLNLFREYEFAKKYKDSWKSKKDGGDVPYDVKHVTVDAVVVKSGNILLVKRKSYPGKDLWALPGGHLNQYESVIDGVIRELREETKLKVPTPVLLGHIKGEMVADDPFRSTIGRVISHVRYIDLGNGPLPKVKGMDDAKKAKWTEISKVKTELMFDDHACIIDKFCNIN